MTTSPKVAWWFLPSQERLCPGLGELLGGRTCQACPSPTSAGPAHGAGCAEHTERRRAQRGTDSAERRNVCVPPPSDPSPSPHNSPVKVDSTPPTFQARKLRLKGGTQLTLVTQAGFDPRSVSPQRNSRPLQDLYLRMVS